MTKISEARDQIMGWIQNNYYLEMQGLLESEGYECASKEEAPWYTTDCPRSIAMGLHNQALTRLLDTLAKTPSMQGIGGHFMRGMLKQKYFSDRDITKQEALEATPQRVQ